MEYTIWIEHWNTLEDKALAQRTSTRVGGPEEEFEQAVQDVGGWSLAGMYYSIGEEHMRRWARATEGPISRPSPKHHYTGCARVALTA